MTDELTGPRFEQPDVFGEHEAADFLNLSLREFRKLHTEDPDFPMCRALKRGPVWSGHAIRAYDTQRRKMGVYYPPRKGGGES